MHGAQLVGQSSVRGVLDRSRRGEVELVDEHDHDVAAQDRRLRELRGASSLELCVLRASYCLFSRTRTYDHDRDEHDDDPGAVGELGDRR